MHRCFCTSCVDSAVSVWLGLLRWLLLVYPDCRSEGTSLALLLIRSGCRGEGWTYGQRQARGWQGLPFFFFLYTRYQGPGWGTGGDRGICNPFASFLYIVYILERARSEHPRPGGMPATARFSQFKTVEANQKSARFARQRAAFFQGACSGSDLFGHARMHPSARGVGGIRKTVPPAMERAAEIPKKHICPV